MLASSTEISKPLVFTNLDEPETDIPGSFPFGAKRRRHSSAGSSNLPKVSPPSGITKTHSPRIGSKHSGSHVANHIPSDPNQTCRVCEGRASGLHFGEYTCESCKLFFLRQTKHEKPNQKIVCPLTWNCDINTKVKSKCRACRFKKCCEVGMSKDRVIYGRNARAKPAMYNLSSAGPIPSPAPLNSPGSISPGSGVSTGLVTNVPNIHTTVESFVNTFRSGITVVSRPNCAPPGRGAGGPPGSVQSDFEKTAPFVNFHGPQNSVTSLPVLNFFDPVNTSPQDTSNPLPVLLSSPPDYGHDLQCDFNPSGTRMATPGQTTTSYQQGSNISPGSFCEIAAAAQAAQKQVEIKVEPGTLINSGCFVNQKGSQSPQNTNSPNSTSPSPTLQNERNDYLSSSIDDNNRDGGCSGLHNPHQNPGSWNNLVFFLDQNLVSPVRDCHKVNNAHINAGSPLENQQNPNIMSPPLGNVDLFPNSGTLSRQAPGTDSTTSRPVHTLDAMQTGGSDAFNALQQFGSREQNPSVTSQLNYQSGNSSGSESDDRSVEFLLNDRFANDRNQAADHVDSQPPEGTVSELWLELPNLEFVCKYCFKSPCFCFGVCKF